MGDFSSITGLVTIIIIFLSKGIVRKYGWYKSAIITPIIFLITSTFFFTLIFFEKLFDTFTIFLGCSSLFLAVIVGAAQNFISKGAKYAIFDPTKEMAYIPLDHELKTKGKAAVDVAGGRLGKASGALTFSVFLVPNTLVAAPYFAVLAFITIIAWIFAVKKLNILYHKELKRN